MKTSLITFGLMLAAGVFTASADVTITTVVDGVTETRSLSSMTFDNADPTTVTLHFDDASTLVADISLVTVAIDYSGSTAIEDIVATSATQAGVWNLKGQRVADSLEGLSTGVYITNGKKVLVK
ncbi:MAG: hypothetical protein NC339_08000 [Muribaculaceae bacterium]|nr:hypothetical protein [Muribaculaceae bacterium]